MTHDYKRHDTTTLFAALNVLPGHLSTAICMPRHRHQEWLRFLRQLERDTPPDLDLHLIVDNYSTHKHAAVKRWLAKYPRFHVHFTPTSSSWLNMVERFFHDLSENRIRRGSFTSVPELQSAIHDYITHHNADQPVQPKHYNNAPWRETADNMECPLPSRRSTEFLSGCLYLSTSSKLPSPRSTAIRRSSGASCCWCWAGTRAVARNTGWFPFAQDPLPSSRSGP